MKKSILLVAIFIAFNAFSQDKTAYVIYNAKGKKVTYKKMLKTLTEKNVVLFGELHNNPIAHWLQLEVTKDVFEKRDLILGAEMIEADNQTQLNEYLKGEIDQKGLDTLARLWKNYNTDYKPLVDFAKENVLPFIATNIPRRFASLVYKNGFEALDSLSAEEKTWVAPLPIKFDINLPTYQNILEMMGDHGTPNLVKAQATKDATMAYFILKNYVEGSLFLHYNGAYHSNSYEGILWYLLQAEPELNFGTISTVSQENVHELLEENQGIADFIICVDEDMTTTY